MRVINRVAAVWAVVGALLLGWSGVAAIQNSDVDSQYEEAVASSVQQGNFYRVVAGQGRGGPGPMYKLARDLNARSANEIVNFKGDSNRYGGITDELGFDPFNGDNCSECGPLDPLVQGRAVLSKSGRLDDVLVAIRPEKPDKTEGAPALLYVAWILSLPVTGALLFMKQLKWRRQRYGQYEQEMQLLDRMERVMRALPEGGQDYEELARLRGRLADSIETRVGYGERTRRQMEIASLVEEASDSLESIVAGNKALE